MNIAQRISIMEQGSGPCHLMGDGVIGYIYVDHEVYPELRRELNRMLAEIYFWAEDHSDGPQDDFFAVLAGQEGVLEHESEEWKRVMDDRDTKGDPK